MSNSKKFAVIGVGGFIAPRHLQAIKDTGNILVAAYDPHDSVGILDRYGDDIHFFTEFERFDRFAEKQKRDSASNKKIDIISVCSPNYLHDAHIRFGLRIGADVICEKPIVINPWNIDLLQELEKESGKRVWVMLQLRLHPAIITLREKITAQKKSEKHDVSLEYITPRGNWYHTSWKGDIKKSGGVATNIGVHFFDMLIWIFGSVIHQEVLINTEKKMAGIVELEHARVKWSLSIDKEDLPEKQKAEGKAYRSMMVDNESVEFSDGFTDLHTKVYEQILANTWYGLEDAKPAIQLVHDIRNAVPLGYGAQKNETENEQL